MNQFCQGESSGSVKRKRGRPRKDASLKHAHPPPNFVAPKECIPPKVNTTAGIDYMVGKEVTGVIEASFDCGYLLNVRIGDTSSNLRGIVFKPGHYVPITAQNDVAMHIPMIRRYDVPFPVENKGSCLKQKAPAKRKYKRRNTGPPVGVGCSVSPVLVQPVNCLNGSPNSHQMPSDASNMSALGDKNVHMVEPVSMPPGQPILVSQILVAAETQTDRQLAQETKQNDNTPVDKGEKVKPVVASTYDTAGSSQTPDTKTKKRKEELKSSTEDSVVISKQEIGNNDPLSTEPPKTNSVLEPFINHGTGRMTELLQAVQENMEEDQAEIAEQQTSDSEVDLDEPRMEECDPEDEP